jgi:hypothetical protein
MLNKLGLHYHGEERDQKTTVNNGKTVYSKRLKFCVEDGWIDLFLFPDWEARHRDCEHVEPETAGAFLELPEENKPKMMAAAT